MMMKRQKVTVYDEVISIGDTYRLEDTGDARQTASGARIGDILYERLDDVQLQLRVTSRECHRWMGVGRSGYDVICVVTEIRAQG